VANAQNGLEETLTKLADALGGAAAPAALTASLGSLPAAGDAAAEFAQAAEQLRAAEQVQANVVSENTEAVTTDSQSGSSGSSLIASIGGVVAGVLEGGFGLGSLIGGLASLFGGGGDSESLPPLLSYAGPEAIRFEGDVHRSANVTDWGGSEATPSGTPLPTRAQITVQVNALDSQSFLDHSQEIARAVRYAMLNSNSLNDVVSDL
jgi:hypothetical protein